MKISQAGTLCYIGLVCFDINEILLYAANIKYCFQNIFSLDMDPQKGSGLLEQKCFQFTLEL